MDKRADLREKEISREEEVFVNFLILQLNSTFYAQKARLVLKLEGLRRDVARPFSLPIPRAIWEKTKVLQNDDFVEFVSESEVTSVNRSDGAHPDDEDSKTDVLPRVEG